MHTVLLLFDHHHTSPHLVHLDYVSNLSDPSANRTFTLILLSTKTLATNSMQAIQQPSNM